MYRTQILLQPQQHRALSDLAQSQGRSLSELMREVVQAYLQAQAQDTRRAQEMQAIENLVQIRRRLREQRDVFAGELLAEARAERDAEIECVWRGEA